ncbi:MAG: glucosidase, partial [Candidatus Eremiobacteraeota bacterium]|nr:glucosidase [Candidatus Eremiobacteraeota bacterium]
IAGICDIGQRICFALALHNGNDPILKERLFGLTGDEGNHGEDVKEYYFYLDNLPSHAYMKMLYKYPHRAYPYAELVEENRRRTRSDPEYELVDTGIFDEDAYFDVFVEYAKYDAEDLAVRITAVNRGTHAHRLDLLPTLWYRNDWSWRPGVERAEVKLEKQYGWGSAVTANHSRFGEYVLYTHGQDELLFTENETNAERLHGTPNPAPWVKDGINDYVVGGREDAVNRADFGTKVAAYHSFVLQPGETRVVRARLCKQRVDAPFADPDAIFTTRIAEADAFYQAVTPYPLSDDLRAIQRQAFAGMLWGKQSYHFVVAEWLEGDPLQPPPPASRRNGRNREWQHLYSNDVISMPDKWEYPWFAAWDLAFHVVTLAIIDPEFAKHQLVLLTREWYMHPNGELPAYEWNFGDVNPPVHAWAALRVFQIEQKMYGTRDRAFLERVFQKLLLNFTWWVNRKDVDGNNVFQGGFLGLDNIGIFDRSAQLPTGGHLNQSDGTSWMCVYTLNLLQIAMELALENNVYEDIASKFFEHFLYIAHALNGLIGPDEGLWDAEDGFYYDVLKLDDGTMIPLKINSLVGLLPLLAIAVGEAGIGLKLPEFRDRLIWFVMNSPKLCGNVAALDREGYNGRLLLSVVGPERLERILARALDEDLFFSPYGIRSISKHHERHPFVLQVGDQTFGVDYEPAESRTGTFGGNSNWRGPVWIPCNYLLVEALQKFHYHMGDDFRVECPVGSGKMLTLWEVSMELSHRLMRIFERNEDGRRAVFGGVEKFQTDPHWRDYIPFYEYFHGDNGAGLGASHQTGWTGLIAKLIQQHGEYCEAGLEPLNRSEPTA